MGDQGHKDGSKTFGVDDVGPSEDYRDTCVSYNPEYRAEAQGLIARDRDRGQFPDINFPLPKVGPEGLCPYCRGTTHVIRANVGLELVEPLTAQIEPCDNPLGCPHITEMGVREIDTLSTPHNNFMNIVRNPNPADWKIMAIRKNGS